MPTSSSGVRRSETAGGFGSRARASRTAMATAIPAFMSKTPGPMARPFATAHGISGRVPLGHTVS